ncbi:MAG: Holliday junction resolvase RuvX [Candidatus Krumholzibacteria bacterium]|nr:Holliday junction resolvase RuvX [Candidatus Krumholzibacteria bacterium]
MSCYLGLDYGLRRIGIAVSDPAKSLAFALGTHVEGRDGSILTHLGGLITERTVTGLVLGLPLTADGREGEMVERVRKFAGRLEREFEVEVILWDERFSSAEADRWLKNSRGSRKEDRDAVAAQIILQSYLDSLNAGAGPQGEQS